MSNTSTRINLSDAVTDLAPPPPPCFFNRRSWIEYLKDAAASQAGSSKKIIVIVDREPQINFDYPFCADCTQVQSLSMTKAGRCNPNFLKEQSPTK